MHYEIFIIVITSENMHIRVLSCPKCRKIDRGSIVLLAIDLLRN